MIEGLEEVFKYYDSRLEEKLDGYPRAFSGNMYWFIVLLADIFYLYNVARRVGITKKKPLFDSFEMDINELSFESFYNGWQAKKKILSCFLEDEFIEDQIEKKKLLKLDRGKIKNKVFTWAMKYNFHNDNIWVIQDGYEVGELKSFLIDDYNFIEERYDMVTIESTVPEYYCSHMYAPNSALFAREEFFGEFFGDYYMSRDIIHLFKEYSKLIYKYLIDFVPYIESKMKLDRPKALLYSIGAINVIEDIYIYVAHKLNIPVFYFQHSGGLSSFATHPFRKYIEVGKEIGIIDYISYGKHGSIELYDYAKQKQRRKNRVLYCPTAPTYNAFKDLMLGSSDKEKDEINKRIVNAAIDSGVKLDIKLHPLELDFSYNYFKKLIKGHRNIKLIKYGKAQDLFGKYSLIVINHLYSSLLPYLMCIGTPIAYITTGDGEPCRIERINTYSKYYEIKSIFDMVKKVKDIKLHRDATGFVIDSTRKFCFDPVANESPGIKIAKHINAVISAREYTRVDDARG